MPTVTTWSARIKWTAMTSKPATVSKVLSPVCTPTSARSRAWLRPCSGSGCPQGEASIPSFDFRTFRMWLIAAYFHPVRWGTVLMHRTIASAQGHSPLYPDARPVLAPFPYQSECFPLLSSPLLFILQPSRARVSSTPSREFSNSSSSWWALFLLAADKVTLGTIGTERVHLTVLCLGGPFGNTS